MNYLIGILMAIIGYFYVLLKQAESKEKASSLSLLRSEVRNQQEVDDQAVVTAKKLLAISLDRYSKEDKHD